MNLYIVPQIGSGAKGDSYRPKYFDALGAPWSGVDIGESFLVSAQTNAAQDASLQSNADVIRVPDNVDGAIALNATANALESLGIPAQWLQAGQTYRQVLQVVVGMAYLIQRCQAGGLRVQLKGHLDDTLGSLSANTRNIIAAAIDSFGTLDRSSFVGTTTIRAVLASIGQQFIAGAVQLPWAL